MREQDRFTFHNRNDNIMIGFTGWAQPYRFVVSRCLKWDPKTVEVLDIADDAATAYAVAKHHIDSAKDSIRQVMFDYFLTDSFNKDATEFCEAAYKKAMAKLDPIVKIK